MSPFIYRMTLLLHADKLVFGGMLIKKPSTCRDVYLKKSKRLIVYISPPPYLLYLCSRPLYPLVQNGTQCLGKIYPGPCRRSDGNPQRQGHSSGTDVMTTTVIVYMVCPTHSALVKKSHLVCHEA